jgi:signal transduction histidine kinase
MLSWLVDNPTYVYVTLGIVALGFLIGLWTTRKRRYAIGLGIVAGLALLFFLFTLLMPTDLKRIRHAIDGMGAGVREKNTDRIFDHISDRFRLGSLDKEAFRSAVDPILKRGDVTEINVWDFRDADISREKRTGTLVFQVKPQPEDRFNKQFYRCKATFVLDPDDQWRLKGFELFNPFVDTDTPLNVPELIPR